MTTSRAASFKTGMARLIKLADHLETADEEHILKGEMTYSQERYVHPCGAPACALGHYTKVAPERWRLKPLRHDNGVIFYYRLEYRRARGVGHRFHNHNDWSAAKREFCLTEREAFRLFDANGCNGATSAKQAARYIREFVARRRREEAQ